LGSRVEIRQPWWREQLGRGFNRIVRGLTGLPYRDTQCGFKMFRGDSGRRLFHLAEEKGYLFDLELLMLAGRLGYRIAEIPINWSDKPGSRLNLMRELWKILSGLRRLRRRRVSLRCHTAGQS
jgi:hypothetical protein